MVSYSTCCRIIAFPTTYPGMYFSVDCVVEGVHGEKGNWFQAMSNLPSCLGNQSWPLALHDHRPLFSPGIKWVVIPFPSGNEVECLFNTQPVAQDGSKWKEKVVLLAISHVNSRFLSCTICTLLGKLGFYFSIWIILPQKRSSMNQYTAAYFNVICSIIVYHWLSQQNS